MEIIYDLTQWTHIKYERERCIYIHVHYVYMHTYSYRHACTYMHMHQSTLLCTTRIRKADSISTT